MRNLLRLVTDARNIWIAVALAGLVFRCDKDKDNADGPPDPCDDPFQLTIATPAEMEGEPAQVAQLSLDELVHIDETGALVPQGGLLKANFSDVTNYVEGITPVIGFGPSCVGRIGDPTDDEGLVEMTVDAVVFRSDVFGEISLVPNEEGVIPTHGEPVIFSDEGGESIEITVNSTEGDMVFPEFATEILAPKIVETTATERNTNGSFTIEWVASDAAFMEITLTTEAPNLDPNRLRCFFLEDDGCFVVPAEAMEWLTSRGVNDARLRMERHAFSFAVASKIALAEIDAFRSIESDINVE